MRKILPYVIAVMFVLALIPAAFADSGGTTVTGYTYSSVSGYVYSQNDLSDARNTLQAYYDAVTAGNYDLAYTYLAPDSQATYSENDFVQANKIYAERYYNNAYLIAGGEPDKYITSSLVDGQIVQTDTGDECYTFQVTHSDTDYTGSHSAGTNVQAIKLDGIWKVIRNYSGDYVLSYAYSNVAAQYADPEYLFNRGFIDGSTQTETADNAVEQKTYNLAISYFQNAVKLFHNNNDAYFGLADVYVEMGNYNDAIGTYQECLNNSKTVSNVQKARVCKAISLCYLTMGQSSNAAEYHSKAIDCYNQQIDADNQSINYCNSLLQQDPNNTYAANNLSVSEKDLSQTENELATFENQQ